MVDTNGIGTEYPTSEEHVGTMLPIVGLNGTALTKSDNTMGFSKPVFDFIENDDAEYDVEVRESVNDSSKEYEASAPLSEEVKKIITQMSVLRAKIKSLTLSNPVKNKNQIIDTKREVIALKKKLNEMTKDASKEQQRAMKKLAKESYKSAISKLKEEKKNASNEDTEDREEKEVKESVDLIIEKTDEEDKKVLSPELKRLDFKRGKLADLERDLEKAQSKFIDTGDIAYEKKVTGLSYKIEKLKKEIAEDEAKVKKATQESVVLTEAANMEDEIKPIVNKLNEKGYKVKYASPGHRNLRKKEDKEPDGVYYDKLYSDARIMFKDLYKFPDAPKYWHWREVDGCSYLDISPLSYNKKDGTPDEAFAKWKENYMNSLRKFVDELGKEEDEVKESVDEFAESMLEDIFSKMGFDELEISESVTESYSDSYDKVLEEFDNLLS